MKLIAYDPFVSVDNAQNLQVELVSLEQLMKDADIITIHIPLTTSTKGIIGAKELALVKPSVYIINCARGGLIEEEALVAAVKEKRIAGAAIDVFAKEPTTESPLFEFDNIIVTPHLGASTTEAQAMTAKEIAEQVVNILKGQSSRYAVNSPFISAEALSTLTPFLNLTSIIGRLVSQLIEGQMKSISVKYNGEIADYDTNALKASVLGGLLEGISEERVNLVNANVLAARRGLTVVEQKDPTCENYASLITVEATTSTGTTTVSGTVIRGEAHIVQINNYWIDIIPSGGYFLFSDHKDRPGLISAVSKVTGDADVNISYMHVSRLQPRGQALMVLALDAPLSEEQLQQILSIEDVYTVKLVEM
jgi:D-3-phosphoglycerate dehydrogenase